MTRDSVEVLKDVIGFPGFKANLNPTRFLSLQSEKLTSHERQKMRDKAFLTFRPGQVDLLTGNCEDYPSACCRW